ncbi:MAG TPA: cupin domain-containing protein [Acidimicrobiia bacterium]|nr:cupin domain-containing protein [Acidimicrobiia bacterium]
MKVRRVVTGHDDAGSSVLVSDEQVAPVPQSLEPGIQFIQLWGADQIPSLPTDGREPARSSYFPPPGGVRFAMLSLAPGVLEGPPSFLDTPGADIGAALLEVETTMPGLLATLELDNPGMHTTDTIDFGLVLSGELWLELDDGAAVRLGPGDTFVQNGTRHAWRNRSDEPAVLVVALVGAERFG